MRLILFSALFYITGVLIFWIFADYDKEIWCTVYYLWEKIVHLLGFLCTQCLLQIVQAADRGIKISNIMQGVLQTSLAVAIIRILYEVASCLKIDPVGGWQQLTQLQSMIIIVIFTSLICFSSIKRK